MDEAFHRRSALARSTDDRRFIPPDVQGSQFVQWFSRQLVMRRDCLQRDGEHRAGGAETPLRSVHFRGDFQRVAEQVLLGDPHASRDPIHLMSKIPPILIHRHNSGFVVHRQSVVSRADDSAQLAQRVGGVVRRIHPPGGVGDFPRVLQPRVVLHAGQRQSPPAHAAHRGGVLQQQSGRPARGECEGIARVGECVGRKEEFHVLRASGGGELSAAENAVHWGMQGGRFTASAERREGLLFSQRECVCDSRCVWVCGVTLRQPRTDYP